MEHEASVLSMIGPDTAPELIEAFTHEGSHCLALQAAEIHGGCADLSSFCVRAQRMSEAERGLTVRSVAQKVLLCVEALHKKRLVHCDIKPSHFLRFDGVWKLIDYDSVLSEGAPPPLTAARARSNREAMRAALGALPLRIETMMAPSR